MEQLHTAMRLGRAAPKSDSTLVADAPAFGEMIDLTQADLSLIAKSKRDGTALPSELAHRTAVIVAAALQGNRVSVVPEPAPSDTLPDSRKRIATCQARAALVGATLVEIPSDDGRPELILSRWALTRAFSDLAELERTLDRMGAPT